MFYLKIYLLISLLTFIFFFGKLIFSGDIKNIKDAQKKIGGSCIGAILWLPIILFVSIGEAISYFDRLKWANDDKNLSNTLTKLKKISDDYIFNNRMGLNSDELDKLQSAYSYIFKNQDNRVRIEYIQDLIDGMQLTEDDGSDLLSLLEQTNTERFNIRTNHITNPNAPRFHLKTFDTRLVITKSFADSFDKIDSLEKFLHLCKSILDVNQYLGTSWGQSKILPDNFSLNGLLLSINVSENLCLFISTASDSEESSPKACILLLTEKPEHTFT